MKISVIIPTHNRNEKLLETLLRLRQQDFHFEDYEILVVDDGSNPPVSFSKDSVASPTVSVIRLEGVERSIARNTGAKNAKGELLVFVDDDISVKVNFLTAHWQAYQEFPDALMVGRVLLPTELQNVPFVRFRQTLERNEIPTARGLIEAKNFCTAQNMAIRRDVFDALGGFEEHMVSSEDQDFALRHTSRGGRIVFVPDALVIHCDSAMDIRSYCRRSEWGSRLMQPFYERYPDLPANVERARVNGEVEWGKESVSKISRKVIKTVIASPVVIKPLFLVAEKIERVSPESAILERIYRLLLGAHIFRGYRAAMNHSKAEAK